MIPASALRAITCVAVFIVVLTTSPAWTADMGTLTGVHPSPEGGRIMLEFEKLIGKHTTFVMQSPNRLVMDIDATRIGRVPSHVKVDRDPIKEIRIGHNDTRARVVVDFGDRPVPQFKVHRQDNAIVVALESGSTGTPRPISSRAPDSSFRVRTARPQAVHTRPTVQPGNTHGQAVTRGRSAETPELLVKASGANDDLVFVELADRRDPKRTYRLVVDVDKGASKVRNVTLSDARGNLRRFDVGVRTRPGDGAENVRKPAAGPRRGTERANTESAAEPKFQWGLDAARTRPPEGALVAVHSPFSAAGARAELPDDSE
jgi:hypothetical protein